ncbi:MAG: lipoate--protein ligase family protein [Verrucomicrobiota bacterium]|nr:lipoate--protein ligase family protein [Verrucomicrobiota bacterium]
MQWTDRTLSTPEENLAYEEALLDFCEQNSDLEVLRFWMPQSPFVVLGCSNSINRETNRAFCEARHLPILRRCSGGGTVLQLPGSLNFAVVLQIDRDPLLHNIVRTNDYVLSRNLLALDQHIKGSIQGISDLTIDNLKFSGNAQRRKRKCLLFHGTFLLNGVDLNLITQALSEPARQPDYRADRTHNGFLTTLPIASDDLKTSLKRAWEADSPFTTDLSDHTHQLVQEKYSLPSWNQRIE